jgi:hypothetical protein
VVVNGSILRPHRWPYVPRRRLPRKPGADVNDQFGELLDRGGATLNDARPTLPVGLRLCLVEGLPALSLCLLRASPQPSGERGFGRGGVERDPRVGQSIRQSSGEGDVGGPGSGLALESVLTPGSLGSTVGNFSDARRADSARADLPGLIGSKTPVGLVLLDDDDREQTMIHGDVIRVGPDSLVFRRNGLDEEIPLGIVSKRVQGDVVVLYGDRRQP